MSKRLALGLAALSVVAYLGSELYVLGRPGFSLDDSWIHLQFARQLAAGEGLSYNPDRFVAGTTAPLWTALLALGFLLPGGAFLGWTKLLGAAFFLASIDAAARLAAELDLDRRFQALAAMLVAASHWLIWSALSGMEVPLFTCLSLWGLTLHLRQLRQPGQPPLALPVLALAALARPEGLLPLVLAAAQGGWHDLRGGSPRRWALGVLAATLVLAPVLVVYQVQGGSVVPTTFGAKTVPDGDPLPDLAYLGLVAGIFARANPVVALLAIAGLAVLAAGGGPGRWRGLLPAAWILGQPLAYSLVASTQARPVGNFGRYYFPLLPVAAVLALIAAQALVARAGARRRERLVFAAVAALTLLPQLATLIPGPLRHVQTVANVEDSDVRAALWLRPRLPAGAVLAVQDIGALKFFLDQPVIDLTGIVTPEILPALRGQGEQDPVYWEERLARFLAGRQPDYLVVFAESYPLLSGRAQGFRRVRSFEVPNNVTMAGSELVIVATPWNRHPLVEPEPANQSPAS